MLYPKIGIRPTIDGRWGGIREGLEEQTMGLATAAKALIETLNYPDATPVPLHPERRGDALRHALLVLRHGNL